MFRAVKNICAWDIMCLPEGEVRFLEGVGATACLPKEKPRTDGVHPYSHEPIYPASLMSRKSVGSKMSRMSDGEVLYDYICRHFLAQCSGDAILDEDSYDHDDR